MVIFTKYQVNYDVTLPSTNIPQAKNNNYEDT